VTASQSNLLFAKTLSCSISVVKADPVKTKPLQAVHEGRISFSVLPTALFGKLICYFLFDCKF